MKHKNWKNKLLSALMAAVMTLSLLPATALAVTVDDTYTPGTYNGTATGFKGDVTVTVTLAKDGENTVISNIAATGEKETSDRWENAVKILDTIKTNNSTDGLTEKLNNKEIDAVSGATISAKAIVAATEDALSKASSGFSGGSGKADDPYLISSEAGLRYLQAQVAAGTTYVDQYLKLTSDIALTGEWTPIGSSSALAFGGTFDGDGHTISGMTITNSALGYAGLFGYTLNGVVIQNVHLTDVSINISGAAQNVYAGALVAFIKVDTSGTASSVIDNCTVSGSISITTANKVTVVGGLTGFTDQRAAITNCGTDVTVIADSGTGRATVGGLSAWVGLRSLFMNNYTLGDVSVTTTHATYGNVGGAFGQVNGIIYNVYTAGNVTLTSPDTATYKPGAIAGDLAAATYADSCYYVGDTAFGAESGKSNAETIGKKTADEVASEGFAQLLHDNLAPAAITAMTANVKNANVSGCADFTAMTARVNDAFQDWTLSKGKVVLSGSLWVNGEIDASIFASGDGSEETPYLITNDTQLRAFAASLNDKIDYTGKFVALGDNIDVSSAAWTPIGGSDFAFNGTFDGQGFAISGMTLGTKGVPAALEKGNPFMGLFGVLGAKSVVKNVNLTGVALHVSYEATAYLGGIAGYVANSRGDHYTGAVIDGCSVQGALSLTSTKGNQFVGGLVGMQYKGAILNSSAKVNASGVVTSGDLAEVGGLVGLNNRGLVANCWSDSDVYGSGSRANGDEGMAVVSNLIACNAGALVNCYASGDVTTKEYSTYAGMVSGWVTGIGKSYTCWYDLDSTMILGKETDTPLTVNPVESIGTKVASGVNDEGDAYTGGLVDKMTGYRAAGYAAVAEGLNGSFAAFPIDITVFGLENSALKTWTYDAGSGLVTLSDTNGTVTYVQPDCEKVEKPEQTLQDGTWYGRDAEKTTVVKITVVNGEITKTEVLSGESSGDAYNAALAKAQYKATYGDFSHYEAADPSNFAGGSGTEADPYRIASEAQLRYLAASLNADVDWSGKYFKQTADITLTGEWLPIGWALNGEVNGKKTAIAAYPFRGSYDGGNFTISGLTIGSESAPADQMASGLFGLTAGEYSTNDQPAGGEQVVRLSNIHLRNIDINVATRYETFTGGLVGSGQTGIYIGNCSVTGKISVTTVESFARAGGMAASVLRGAVTNSWADVDITAVTDTNNVYAGGFYGMDNRVTTINCYALGDVTGSSTNNNKIHIGGFIGQAGAIHVNCYAAGDVVSCKTTTDVGAFSGRSGGITIDSNCYYNASALLKQGNTTLTTVVGIGVAASGAVEDNVVGKTAADLKSDAFAAMLNSNLTKASMKASWDVVDEGLADQNERKYSQVNYYAGTALLPWTVKDGVVTFGENSGENGGTSGGSSGGSAAPSEPETPFTDIPEGSPYESAILWAVKNGITTGTTATTFSPSAPCTRAQAVTFLWRAAGSPELKSDTMPFADVAADSVYAKAILWAVEQGITLGTTESTFSPNAPCARGQIVTFLYRAAGSPAVDGAADPFTDVSADSPFLTAILWAVKNGVTTGTTATTFAPSATCTRGQIVTFLYRTAN